MDSAASKRRRAAVLTANRSSRQDLPTPESPISRSCGERQGEREGAQEAVAGAPLIAQSKRRPAGPTLNRKSYSDWCAMLQGAAPVRAPV